MLSPYHMQDSHCHFRLQRVDVSIQGIRLPSNCTRGNIAIFDGSHDPGSMLATLCGTLGEQYHYSSQDSILVVFSLDSAEDADTAHFSLNYTITEQLPVDIFDKDTDTVLTQGKIGIISQYVKQRISQELTIDALFHSIREPCYVMLCYVMLCYVMLCYVMLCYVMLCYVMLCYVMLCYVMLCYVMLCYVMLCYVMLCYVMLCYVMLCYVMLCYVML